MDAKTHSPAVVERPEPLARPRPPKKPGPQPLAGTRERGGSPWLGQIAPGTQAFEQWRELDRLLLSSVGQFSGGLSPATLGAAFGDWWVHWLASPAKQMEVAQLFVRALQAPFSGADTGTAPLPQDKRFADPAWQLPPFNTLMQGFLLAQSAWQHATTGVPGVSRHHEDMVSFGARQLLDMLAPSNFIATNPAVLMRTLAEGGQNLARGALHVAEDAWREAQKLPPVGAEAWQVGVNLAITPGRVVMRNRLAELIQYEPSTPRTQAEPVLVVPAWIMKYYVLDLSPHNSLIKALVDQGFTVFAISWHNPGPQDRDTRFADYFHLGLDAALQAIGKLMPATPVHALGYCLGGTLLAMGAAALARSRPQALKTVTLLAAQTDFSDPGELGLFIDEGQVELLDAMMWRQGVLRADQMKGTFQMLRSRDLVWSHHLGAHLLGERRPVSDLMAWNADGTHLPYRMHSEYLHGMFLENALARGRATLDGQALNLADIRVPIFNLGAVQDHVAPWRSVFKLHALTDAEQTFVLTAGGHNVGIVNPPGQARTSHGFETSHRLRTWHAGERLLTPDEWLATTPLREGSWWTPWFEWLAAHSSGWRAPPPLGAPRQGLPVLGPAPGLYVHER